MSRSNATSKPADVEVGTVAAEPVIEPVQTNDHPSSVHVAELGKAEKGEYIRAAYNLLRRPTLGLVVVRAIAKVVRLKIDLSDVDTTGDASIVNQSWKTIVASIGTLCHTIANTGNYGQAQETLEVLSVVNGVNIAEPFAQGFLRCHIALLLLNQQLPKRITASMLVSAMRQSDDFVV